MPVPPLPPRSSSPYALPRRRGFWPVLRGIGRGLNLLRLAIINVVFFTFLLVLLLLIAGGIAGSGENQRIAANSVLVLKPE
ncbi:MAG TPA: signal peptide peptidase SppA, partial [Rhodanobacter sp.]|nr:signal peptide peptidase SppA [Rhodanobacter sp.]